MKSNFQNENIQRQDSKNPSQPDFNKWAEDVLCEKPRNLHAEVRGALRQAWEQGYRYAVRNDWWREQDKNNVSSECICGHQDNRHEDIDDGTVIGNWGAGKCELCRCSRFENKEDEAVESIDKCLRSICDHESDGLVYFSNPPQNKCKFCGKFYK